jgi:hypothetical protein
VFIGQMLEQGSTCGDDALNVASLEISDVKRSCAKRSPHRRVAQMPKVPPTLLVSFPVTHDRSGDN